MIITELVYISGTRYEYGIIKVIRNRFLFWGFMPFKWHEIDNIQMRETLVAYFDNPILVVRTRNMNKF
jgi:hypothetical protein